MEDIKYHLVTSDIFSSSDKEEDIGIISVKDDYESREHHWVTFPDKTIRRNYSSRKIDSTDYDLLDAFGVVPVLKVSYRPISKFLNECSEFVALFIVLVVGIIFVIGLGLIYASQVDGLVNMILNNSYAFNTLTVVAIAIPLSVCFLLAVLVGENRWLRLTKYDVEVNERSDEYRKQQRDDEVKANGYF